MYNYESSGYRSKVWDNIKLGTIPAVVLWVLTLILTCQSDSKNLTFKGFTIGETADKIINTMGREPNRRSVGSLEYKGGDFEGVPASNILYDMAGGKLVAAHFVNFSGKSADYNKLLALLTDRYGKPTQVRLHVLRWMEGETLLVLSGEGSLSVFLSRKDLANKNLTL